MDPEDEDLKARLLASFCPVLRFDAAEKHYPVRAELFVSSSLLLRRPKNPGEVRAEMRRQRRREAEEGNKTEKADKGNENDELHRTVSAGGSGGDGDGADGGDDSSGDGALADEQSDQEKMQQLQLQACGECGQRQGWKTPSKGKWTLVDLPPGAQSWSTSTLLDEQRRDPLHEFRLEPHCCIWDGQEGDLSAVPCYAFADLLDPSTIAPFIRIAGLGPVYELKYAFLYGYNGTTFAIPGTSVGVHTGDLEHVTVRVDARRMMILEVFFAAHGTGEGKWITSKDFYRQVEAWEAATHPGVAAEAPESTREFLEMEEASESPLVENAGDAGDQPESGAAGTKARGGSDSSDFGAAVGGCGERFVIYPARNGHASYHMPKRWRRFVGLGDDVCGGDGKVWRPLLVQLDHPRGRTPPWLQFRGRWGGTQSIACEGFWKGQGEAPRRCSAEAKYRSLLEEGLVPDRGVRLGPSRRMLHGNADRGVWLERHRQTENRVPFANMWTRVPGLSSSRPRDQDSPRSAGREWLADWGFLQDAGGGSTDADGWSYYGSQSRYADTGMAGRPKDEGLLVHRSRGRVWFRVAATPGVAKAVEEARRRDGGRNPRRALALAALDVAGRGEVVTPESLLQTLRDGVQGHGAGSEVGASSVGQEAASRSTSVLTYGRPDLVSARGAMAPSMSFGSVARRSLGQKS